MFTYHDHSCSRYTISNAVCGSIILTPYSSTVACCDDCFKVKAVSSFKYLHVLIDKNLKWSEHINVLRSYLRSSLRAIYNLTRFFSQSVLKIIYHSIFLSRMEYGLSSRGNAANSISDSVLILQKSAIWMVSGRDMLHCSFPFFKNLTILPLKQLYYCKVLKILFSSSGNLNSG